MDEGEGGRKGWMREREGRKGWMILKEDGR